MNNVIIGLAQVDGKWPNLALMKLAAWHKRRSDTVRWYAPVWREEYDLVYASKVFTDTEDDLYLPPSAVRGGSGYDLAVKLPAEIEAMCPDYSIYPRTDFALGFTTRGCVRRCPFCVVPQKEGSLQIVGDIYSFWTGQPKVVLLDNNLTAAPFSHFEKVVDQLARERLLVDFSQGLDIRLLTREHVELLTKVRLWKFLRFAWDNPQDEEAVRRGITLLRRHFHPSKLMFYVLVGFNTTPEEDLYRVETLRGLGVNPFVMPFNREDCYQRDFARWVNHKAIFKSVPWNKYRKASASDLVAAGGVR